MKQLNKQTGNKGEELAADFLKKNGWQILETNFSGKWGEIDIICSKDNVLSFVEVKTKSTDEYGTPESMINRRKIMQIQRMSDLFLEKNKKLTINFDTYRIDVVAITLETSSINYYENVGADFI